MYKLCCYRCIYTPPGPPSSCEVPRLVREEHSRGSTWKYFIIRKYFQDIFQQYSPPGPGAPGAGRPPCWRTARGEVSVDLDVGQPGSQLPDGGPRDSLAVVTKHKGQVRSGIGGGECDGRQHERFSFFAFYIFYLTFFM